METHIKTFKYNNGEVQRVQWVECDDWKELCFFSPKYTEGVFENFCSIYRNAIIPKFPLMYGDLVIFRLPEDVDLPQSCFTGEAAQAERLMLAAEFFRKHLKVKKGEPVFDNDEAAKLYAELRARKSAQIISGRKPFTTTIIPVSDEIGFMSGEKSVSLRVNSSFFIMPPTDCDSPYDIFGTPFGLCVKSGEVLSPPLFGREALMVREADASDSKASGVKISVETPDVRELIIEMNGESFRHGTNCKIYVRPESRSTHNKSGTDFVIVGNRIVAIQKNTSVKVPCSGFVLHIDDVSDRYDGLLGSKVVYRGMENVIFGVQAGGSAVVRGVKTERFISKFYSIFNPLSVVYPPSLYPLDYKNDRAPRIVLGADKNGKPVFVWAEGRGTNSYTPGEDSCGASLSEMADICMEIGLFNAVNLDGGGSAQILVDGRRFLMISGRNKFDNTESERPVPMGIYIK